MSPYIEVVPDMTPNHSAFRRNVTEMEIAQKGHYVVDVGDCDIR
jgi:hypothetical protein